MSEKNKKIFHFTLITLLLAAAFFVRIYRINEIPAGIYPDESVNGTDALLANETGNHRWFYTNNYGREGLFINLQSLTIRLIGNTIIGLKLWSMIFGTLTVFGIYLLTRELFKSFRSGLVAAYLAAFSFWAINFSRIGFRAIMVPFLLSFTFYFLFKGVRTKHMLHFIVGGLIFGLGFHTYIAYRIAPAILIVALVGFIISYKNFLKVYWKHILVFGVCVFITAAPILLDFVRHPEYFESRSNSISVFSPEVNKGDPAGTLLKSLGLSLVKYNFWGDQNWRHNLPPYPILNFIVGVAFLSGLIYLIFKTFHLLILRFKHSIRDEKLAIYIFLLAWFFIMLAPEFLTAEGLPHALRSIGALPVVFIMATVSFLWVLGRIENKGNLFKKSVFSLLILAFLTIGLSELTKYFYIWPSKPDQHGQFNENYKNMAIFLNSQPENINKYVFANGSGREMEDGLPVSAQVIKYLTYGKSDIIYLKRGSDVKLVTPLVLVLMSRDEQVIANMQRFYPQAKVEKLYTDPRFPSDFTAIIVP